MEERKKIVSIFNDVLSPVTPGPSAGCTGGPYRIGRACRSILGEEVKKFTVEVPKGSSYEAFLRGMRSDLAFLNGIMGRSLEKDDPDFTRAFQKAEELGMEVAFLTREFERTDEFARLTLVGGETGTVLTADTLSVGAGMFRILALDGCAVDIQGYDYDTLLFLGPGATVSDERIRGLCEGINQVAFSQGQGTRLIDVKSYLPQGEETMAALRAIPGVIRVAALAPEHAVILREGVRPAFSTPQEMLDYQERTGKNLWELAVEYERSVSGWSQEQVEARCAYLWSVIEASAENGLREGVDMNGFVPCLAKQLKEGFESEAAIPLGAAGSAANFSHSIMESSNASGVILSLPTGGSSGVVPGAIYGACKSMGKDRKEMERALLVSGLLGVFMNETDYNGTWGCQAEIGCAAGMAAGAMVYLLGGSAKQACDSAALAIECLLGLVCDTVAGLVIYPCFIRNMVCPAISMICANAAFHGMEAVVPLEETVSQMMRLGREFNKNCKDMGACASCTGRRIQEEQNLRDKKLRGLEQ